MDYTITNLDSRLKTYLETNGVEVLTKALFNSESAKYFNIQTGVTAEQPIIRLDSTITLADASNCGFTATGSDTFTNRLLSPKFLKVNKEFSLATLNTMFVDIDNRIKKDELSEEQALQERNKIESKVEYYSECDGVFTTIFKCMISFIVLTIIHFLAGIGSDIYIQKIIFSEAFYANIPLAFGAAYPFFVLFIFFVITYLKFKSWR